MAVPPFGFLAAERLACGLMVLASVVGLAHATQLSRAPWVSWATWDVSFGWLVVQAGLVAVAGIAAFNSRSFLLTAVGIVAGLVFSTRVGAIAVGPTMILVSMIMNRFTAFTIFAPKWRGPGRPPPGYWR